ncbi:hypothetical protein BC629DRAFT_876996 [Irpex lacteus]|nr:hypothetical protein BC629DRAFT_876996 [Irpex lacteus]
MSPLTSPYNTSSSLDLSTLRESRIDTVLGPLYISVMLFSMLYGILTVQVVLYYQRCKKDRSFLRCTAPGYWVIRRSHLLWLVCICNRACQLPGYRTYAMDCRTLVHCIGVNETVVCSIMMWMAWTLSSKKKWLYVVMIIPAMAAFAGFIGYSVISFRNPTAIAEKSNSWTWYLPFAGHAFVDIIICIALTTSLIKMHTGLRKSDFVVRLLVVWFLNSGFLASMP